MVKKNMQSIVAALTPVADELPTQNVTPRAVSRAPDEPIVQFSFSLRKSLRKELARLADDYDMTMRAFILQALKEKGLNVTETDMLDLRKERG